MSSRYLTATLATLLGLVLTMVVVVRRNPTQTNWELLPEMVRSPALQAFEVTPVFRNRRAQQGAVVGTIPRGYSPWHFSPSKEDAQRAGEELPNPYRQNLETDTASLSASASKLASNSHVQLASSTQRGEKLYRIYCVSCHGAGGAGDGPVAQRGFPPPPPLPQGKSVQMQDGQLFHILTSGQGSMPSMAAQIDRGQRWDVINFVRSLQHQGSQDRLEPTTQTDLPSQPDRVDP